MAQVSPPLIALLKEKPTGTTSAFDPDYLYLLRFPRIWSSPILGFCMRAPSGQGSVAFVLVADGKDEDKGKADEVLFKTELLVPAGKDCSGFTSLVVTFPEPVIGHDNFWLGFRFSAPVEVPLRFPVFTGQRTAAKLDLAKLSGSLLHTAMEDLINDQKLGMPILFPIFDDRTLGVDHGA